MVAKTANTCLSDRGAQGEDSAGQQSDGDRPGYRHGYCYCYLQHTS